MFQDICYCIFFEKCELFDRMLAQIYILSEGIYSTLYIALYTCYFYSSDFKSDKNEKVMFLGSFW